MNDMQTRVVQRFDNWAGEYDTAMRKAQYFAPDWIRKNFFDIGSQSECRVLDLGCGTGLNVRTLFEVRDDFRAVGVDVSPKMIEYANAARIYERLYIHDLNLPLQQMSSDSFDLVIAFGFFEMLKNAATCVSECSRLLKKHGTFWGSFRLFEEEGSLSPPRHMLIDGIDVVGHSSDQILQMMDNSHFRITALDTVVGYVTVAGFPCPFYVVNAEKMS